MRSEFQEIVHRWGGHIAQFEGDGALVTFGYPKASRNHALSAVSCGMEIVGSVLKEDDIRGTYGDLQLRVGCHTGVAIAGGGSANGTPLAIASRLQAEAYPGTVVVSEETKRMAESQICFSSLGYRRLKGLPFEREIFQARGSLGVLNGAAFASVESPTVGRGHEMELLRHHWRKCSDHSGRSILIAGEAGIGKSRLTRDFLDGLHGSSQKPLIAYCDERYKNTPYWPFINICKSVVDNTADTVAALNPTHAATLNALMLTVFESGKIRDLTPYDFLGAKVALSQFIRTLPGPIAIAIEDVHWCDPSSKELITELIFDNARFGALLLLTGRTECIGQEWLSGPLSVVHLQPLDKEEITELAINFAKINNCTVSDMDRVVSLSDGIPLFVEELIRGKRDEFAGINPPADPVTIQLQGIIWERLDRLEKCKSTAQIASVIGRHFPAELLSSVLQRLDEHRDSRSIGVEVRTLERHQVLVSSAAGLSFKHALIQEAAYGSIPPSIKKRWHGIVGDTVEKRVDDDPSYFEVLARHRAAAGEPRRATVAYRSAGDFAVRQFANSEAIELYSLAMDEARKILGEGERLPLELELTRALATPILARHGWAASEVRDNARRLLQLALDADEVDDAFEARRSLLNYALLRADESNCVKHLKGMRQLAGQSLSAPQLSALHRCTGAKQLFIDGNLVAAKASLQKSLEVSADPEKEAYRGFQDADGEVTSRSLLSWLAWFAGDLPGALEGSRSVIARAQLSLHPFSMARAYCIGGSNSLIR